MTTVSVRPARPDEWRQARDLRLEMLADTPLAFCERLEDARARDDETWERHHRERTESPETRDVLAAVDDEGRWLGQVGLVISPFPAPTRVWAGAVYLSPALRGTGVATRMMDEAERWALDHDQDELWLEVHEHNPRALGFYRRLGFEETGERRPYPLDPSAREVEMRKVLTRG